MFDFILSFILSFLFLVVAIYVLYNSYKKCKNVNLKTSHAWKFDNLPDAQLRCAECFAPVNSYQNRCNSCKSVLSQRYECPACGCEVSLEDAKCKCGLLFSQPIEHTKIKLESKKSGSELSEDSLFDEETKEPDSPKTKKTEKDAFCPECGNIVGKNEKKCKKCGASFWSAITPPGMG